MSINSGVENVRQRLAHSVYTHSRIHCLARR